MIRYLFLVVLAHSAFAHITISTKITWAKEISRIVYHRCLSCHRENGEAFSLDSYEKARPWAKAIQEEVLNRRMPPWGAVKGFGEFAHDQGLTQEEVNLIAEWVEGGAPEGDPNLVPPAPHRFPDPLSPQGKPAPAPPVFSKAVSITAIQTDAATQVTAEFPNGEVIPLLWTLAPSEKARTFVLLSPLTVPRGTKLRSTTPVTLWTTKPSRPRKK